MAELEIHFPDGLVFYKPFDRKQKLFLGSDEACAVRIDGAGVFPRHCVIRWREGAYLFKVDRSAEPVEFNGSPVGRAILHPGDEFRIAGYRFLVRGEPAEFFDDAPPRETVDPAPARSPKTRSAKPRPAPDRSSRIEDLGRNKDVGRIEEFDGIEELGQIEDLDRHDDAFPEIKGTRSEAEYYTPMWKSRLFLGIAGGLAALGLSCLILWFVIQRMSADKQFDAAMADYADGVFDRAISRYDRFLEDFPDGELAEKALLWRGMARIRQFAEGTTPNWPNALAASKQCIDEAGDSDFFRAKGAEVADLVALTAQGLATRARDNVDSDRLADALNTLELLDDAFPIDQRPMQQIDKVRSLIAQARYAIEREAVLNATLAKMQVALDAKEPIDVYREHRRLYFRYPGLFGDRQCQSLRSKARELEREAVTYEAIEESKPAKEISEPAPARTVVWRRAAADDASSGRVAAVQVADTLYAIDTGSGKVLWRRPIGFEPSFDAFSPPGDESLLLAHASADNSLVLFESATGKLLWRRPMQAALPSWRHPPLIQRGRIYLIVANEADPGSGKLSVFRMTNGRPIGEYRFPQPIAASPVFDRKRQSLLLLAETASLYSLDLADERCERVVPIDHDPGTILSRPFMAGRFFFLVRSGGLARSELQCHVVSASDGDFKLRQMEFFDGWIRHAPFLRGVRLFITTDSGHMSVFDLGAESDAKPMTLAARTSEVFELGSVQPFPVGTDAHEFWAVGEQVELFGFEANSGALTRRWRTPTGGTTIQAPWLERDRLIVAARDKTGRVAVTAIDTRSHQEQWRTELGNVPDAVQPAKSGAEAELAVVAKRRTKLLSIDDLSNDQVVENPLPNRAKGNGSAPGSRSVFATVNDWTDGVLQWAGKGSRRLLYLAPDGSKRQILLPTAMASRPEPFGPGCLVPAVDGLVYWIDPATGRELAEPYVGPYEEGRPIVPGPVTALDDRSIVLAAERNVIWLELVEQPYPHFVESARIELRSASTSYLAKMRDRILMVDGDRLLTLDPITLEELDEWTLGAPVSRPPVAAGSSVLFVNDLGELINVAGEGADVDIRWRLGLEGTPLGAPAPLQDRFWIAFADGRVVSRSLEDGAVLDQASFGRALIDGPWTVGDRLVALAADGSLTYLKSNDPGPEQQ